MNLSDIVIDFEYAKRLKELGVKQESLFYYKNSKYGLDILNYNFSYVDDRYFSAFTAEELLKILPRRIETICNNYYLKIEKLEEDEYKVYYEYSWFDECFNLSEFEDSKLSNALAKMLIYLIENKYIKIEEI